MVESGFLRNDKEVVSRSAPVKGADPDLNGYSQMESKAFIYSTN